MIGYYKNVPAMMKLNLASLVLGSLLSVTAFAGPGSSGGGGGVACVDDVFAPGTNYRDFFKASYNPKGAQNHVYVLDYFQSKIPTVDGYVQPNLFDGKASKMSEAAAFKKLKDQFELILDATGPFDKIDKIIGPIDSWIDSPLQDSKDSGRQYYLPKGCKYVQLAYRQDKTVYGDSEWIKKLNGVQRAILRMHEIYFHAYLDRKDLKPGEISTSAPVRDLLKLILLRSSPNSIEYSDRIRELFERLRINFTPLLGSNYFFEGSERRFSKFYSIVAMTRSKNPTEVCEMVKGDSIIWNQLYSGKYEDINTVCALNGYILNSNWRLAFNTVMSGVHHELERERRFLKLGRSTPEMLKKDVEIITNWLTSNQVSLKNLPGYDDAVFKGALEVASKMVKN